MRKMMVLAATMVLMLVAAAPAFAQNEFQDTYIDGTHEQYLESDFAGELAEQYLDSDFVPDVQYPTNVFINNWR